MGGRPATAATQLFLVSNSCGYATVFLGNSCGYATVTERPSEPVTQCLSGRWVDPRPQCRGLLLSRLAVPPPAIGQHPGKARRLVPAPLGTARHVEKTQVIE